MSSECRFRDDGAKATRFDKPDDGDNRMDEDVVHPGIVSRSQKIPEFRPILEFATDRCAVDVSVRPKPADVKAGAQELTASVTQIDNAVSGLADGPVKLVRNYEADITQLRKWLKSMTEAPAEFRVPLWSLFALSEVHGAIENALQIIIYSHAGKNMAAINARVDSENRVLEEVHKAEGSIASFDCMVTSVVNDAMLPKGGQ